MEPQLKTDSSNAVDVTISHEAPLFICIADKQLPLCGPRTFRCRLLITLLFILPDCR